MHKTTEKNSDHDITRLQFGDCEYYTSTILVDGYDRGYGEYAYLKTPNGRVKFGFWDGPLPDCLHKRRAIIDGHIQKTMAGDVSEIRNTMIHNLSKKRSMIDYAIEQLNK